MEKQRENRLMDTERRQERVRCMARRNLNNEQIIN